MLEELSSKDKVVGLKQVQRAVSAGRAGWVFLACTMAQLGRACGIDVGTAAAALLAKEKPLPTE